MSEKKKIFVPDTSVLIHDCNALEYFRKNGQNEIVIPTWVVDELDHFKHEQEERGQNSRIASHMIENMGRAGELEMEFHCFPVKESDGMEMNNDLRIILAARYLTDKHPNEKVILVSKDTNLRIKARACGVTAEDYESDMVRASVEDIYGSVREIHVSDVRILERFREDKRLVSEEWEELRSLDLCPNECCRFVYKSKDTMLYELAICKRGEFHHVLKAGTYPSNRQKQSKILSINDEQAFSYALLTDPSIEIIALVGRAGTGKTLTSLRAAHEQLKKGFYKQIVVYRTNVEIGRPMGFLPGNLDEKFEPWKWPIFDNLKLILGGGTVQSSGKKKQKQPSMSPLDVFLGSGQMEISPIAYLRGRSLHQTFVIIDDAQNLKSKEAKTIITRMGKDSKVVLTGDIEQIDNPYVGVSSNGISYTIDRWRAEKDEAFGYVALWKGERSRLAETAARIM